MEVGSFMVAGVSFDNRQQYLEKLQKEYLNSPDKKVVRFVKEEDNPYDKNAIAIQVELEGSDVNIGYIPKDMNVSFAALIDCGAIKKAKLASVGRPNYDNKKPIGAKIIYEVDINE